MHLFTRGEVQRASTVTLPHFNSLQHTATHCNTLLQCTWSPEVRYREFPLSHCNTQQTLQHTATHCNTRHCNTLQHTATHCNNCNTLLQRIRSEIQRACTATIQHTITHCNTLQHTATHCCNTPDVSYREPLLSQCSTLQHTASHGKALQRTAATNRITRGEVQRASTGTLRHTTTSCNIMQHTATHCCNAQDARYREPLPWHHNTLQNTATHCNTLHTLLQCTWSPEARCREPLPSRRPSAHSPSYADPSGTAYRVRDRVRDRVCEN